MLGALSSAGTDGIALVTAIERLEPGDARAPQEWLAELRAHERAPADRPFVYVDMVASVDGRAAIEGRTQALGSATDTLLLTELRALADAVLIGSGTLRAEGYGRLVGNPDRAARRTAADRPPTPTAVILSRSLDVPWDAGLFAAADQPVLVYTGAGASRPVPATAAPLELVRLAECTPEAALRDLRGRGVRALLCEGGPTLNRALLAAGVVDELFVTLAPLLAGSAVAPRIVEGPDLPDPLGLTLEWVLHHGDELYLRYHVRHDG
jgi:riboflavin-specific deaminase-like protein